MRACCTVRRCSSFTGPLALRGFPVPVIVVVTLGPAVVRFVQVLLPVVH